MPEHSHIINVEVFPGGNQSWTAVMGANAVRVPAPFGKLNPKWLVIARAVQEGKPFSGDLLDLHDPGCAVWMSREDYM